MWIVYVPYPIMMGHLQCVITTSLKYVILKIKALSMAIIPPYFEFFRCRVDVLQS